MNIQRLHEGRPVEILSYYLPRADVTDPFRTFMGISAHSIVAPNADERSIENIEFMNCHFGESGLTHAHYKNCSFYNCEFGLFRKLKTIFDNCTFENCTFWDRERSITENIEKVYFEGCTFVGGFTPLSPCYNKNSHWLVPKQGAFVMFKKVWIGYSESVTGWDSGLRVMRRNNQHCIGIVELHVPDEAQRWFDPSTKKVRVSEAYVKNIRVAASQNGQISTISFDHPDWRSIKDDEIAFSSQDRDFHYKVGETVRPNNAFSLQPQACTSGIHGFATRREAQSYVIYF